MTCTAAIDLPLSAGAAWGQLRHLPTSAVHDPFHARVTVGAGGSLVIEHRYLGFRTTRVGRVLWWREGVGFAFSDLCRRDAGAAFPHVLSYRLEPTGRPTCRLHVRVGGRWTAAAVGRPPVAAVGVRPRRADRAERAAAVRGGVQQSRG